MKTLKYLTVPILGLLLLYSCQKTTYAPQPPVPSVNAGPSQTITLPQDSARLSGTATDTGSRIKAYLWSEVSGPNVPVIADEGSPSTIVRGLIAGTYIFQLMAVDSAGATGVDTLTISVVSPSKGSSPQTDTLHTFFSGSSYPFELTFLSNPNSPAGDNRDIELLAETWTVQGIEVYGRSFLKFNLTSIPAGTTVKSATLALFSDLAPQNGDLIHANSGANNDFYIQRVTGSWDLTNTTWNNLPATDTTGEAYIPVTSQPFQDLNVDVTKIVNSMLVNGNNGMVMRLKTEVLYNCRIFCTSNYSDSTRHPYLVVTY
jgi:hypothetical protein